MFVEPEVEAENFYGAVRRGFIANNRIDNHWRADRHVEWQDQTSQLSWYLNITHPQLRNRIGQIQQAGDPSFIAQVAPDDLHITLLSVARLEDVDAATVAELHHRANTLMAKSFDLKIGPINSMTEGIIAEVRPWGPITTLRRQLFDQALEILGPDKVLATAHFTPHLSLSYFTEDHDDASVVTNLLEDFEGKPLGIQPVAGVSLVELRREGSNYRFTELAAVRLGQQLDRSVAFGQ